jgi:MerR family copper efflux transcriptional regulator
MKVGEVASRAGVSVRSVRHYERAGLLHASRRPNGYREFDAGAVERVRAIRELLESGFTVEDVLSLASCLQGSPGDCNCCSQTVAVYRDKLARIDQQVQMLTGLRERITQRIAQLEPC